MLFGGIVLAKSNSAVGAEATFPLATPRASNEGSEVKGGEGSAGSSRDAPLPSAERADLVFEDDQVAVWVLLVYDGVLSI